MPSPHFGQPRYRAIADELRRRIESGVIPPGTLFPAESVLTAEFRASRGTIRQAIAALRAEGLAATEHGRGTFANALSYGHNLDSSGRTETSERRVAADAELAALFGIKIGAELIESALVIRKEDRVEAVVRSYRLHPKSD